MFKEDAVQKYKGEVDVIILLSGGLDSTCLALMAREEDRRFLTYYISVNRNPLEMESSRRVCEYLNIPRVMSLGSIMLPLGDEKRNFIPGRNAFFMFDAYNLAACVGASEIWMGCLNNAEYSDTTSTFMYALNDVIAVYEPYIPMRMPLVERYDMTKDDVLAYILRRDRDVLQYTYSCYSGGEPCGECHGCELRMKAFEKAGEDDKYNLDF